jgi:hypothetical protein
MTLGHDEIMPYIREAQAIDIMPYLGEALVLDIVEYVDGKPGTPDYSTLLSGGVYATGGCPSRRVEFAGLKAALAYYTYARLVRNAPYPLTRYGESKEMDAYSRRAGLEERSTMERDARSTADYHAAACARYLQANRATFPLYPGGKPETTNARLRVIPPSC